MGYRVTKDNLEKFCTDVFVKLGVPEKDAQITAEVLVLGDLRGVKSHGVARLKRYVDGIKSGLIYPDRKPKIVRETKTTATISGEDGLGQVAGHFAMNLAIKKAKEVGVGMVTVRNSNHYGIAGYYSLMALKEKHIGISLTNTAPLVVPTFGVDLRIGTNPIAIAAPAKKYDPWVLDMATSVVPRGKLEVYDREEKELPLGWAVDENGISTSDAALVLKNMLAVKGGGILPLGGEGELFSGHKGYGIAAMVDLLCGPLSGGAFGKNVYAKKDGKVVPPNVCHFFASIDIEAFLDYDEFTGLMDKFIEELKESKKAKGQERIYVHGEKEYEKEREYIKVGIPITEKVMNVMDGVAETLSLQSVTKY